MASIGTNPPPAANEIEVSLFGPGFGECVVLHVGEGDWIIVDSCRDLDSHAPVAIAYLEQLGVEIDQSVRRVVATHWHDDHIDGISQIFREADSAAFVCTGAFQHDDFRQLLQNYFGGAAAIGGSGIDELHSVFAEVTRRQQKGNSPALILASANTVIWERVGQLPASVRSLSPSAHDVLVGLGRIHSEQLFGAGRARRRLPSLHPNNVSVVLSIRAGDALVLLGADLQESGHPQRGWQAVVAQWNSAAGLHDYFKVPHHGSGNAHYSGVWQQMLVSKPDVTLTPFRHMLPTPSDRNRIRALAGRSSITAPPRTKRYRSRNPPVQRVITGMTKNVWTYPPNFGHIRCRRAAGGGGTWTVEFFGAAEAL